MAGGTFGSWSNAAPVQRANMTFADYLRDTSQQGNEDYQQLGAGIQPNGQSWLANSTSGAPTGDMFSKGYVPPSLGGLQAAGANPATALSAAAGGATATGQAAPEGQSAIAQQPQQPVTSATPVAPPPKPKRRMVTQSSHSLQGLRAANGAGY